MRTFRVEHDIPLPAMSTSGLGELFVGGGRIRISTEVIAEDDDAREAGTEAARALHEFIAGFGEQVT